MKSSFPKAQDCRRVGQPLGPGVAGGWLGRNSGQRLTLLAFGPVEAPTLALELALGKGGFHRHFHRCPGAI